MWDFASAAAIEIRGDYDGMTLRDLHEPFYISMSPELCTTVEPGKSVSVPLSLRLSK